MVVSSELMSIKIKLAIFLKEFLNASVQYVQYCVTSLPSMVAWVVKTVATLILQVLI
jgi:hypothetical protein